MRVTLQKILIAVALFLSLSKISFAQPANDACANAKLINTDSVCVTGTSRLVGETLTAATADGYTIPTACAYLSTARDIWYRFVAKTKMPTITISNQGSGWGGIGNVRIQLLRGTCGNTSFVEEMACGIGPSITPSITNPLIEGTTYFIRIHKNTATAIAANHNFDICVTDVFIRAGRTSEIFSLTTLSSSNVLQFPWEIIYGPDNNLWITESKGYKVYRMNPTTGVKTMVLDISQGSTFFATAPEQAFNCQFANGAGAQGGLAGMALHPNFLDGTGAENNTVYISYIRSGSGSFFTNRLAKFTFNKVTNKFESPVSICDTLPGSNDHNSQRMIIAPLTIGGPKFLFYASGDMGAGQGNTTNVPRAIKAQFPNSYEGKILRFNLAPDADVANNYNEWIPNDNPYNTMLAKQSAVWNIGQRNNQGFAYDAAANILYGSSHGPYSDDEINILEGFKNYGHPLVIGYAADGNYNGTTNVGGANSVSAGTPFSNNGGVSSCPPIGNEITQRDAINAGTTGQYKDPVFAAYPGPTGTGAGTVNNIWRTTTGANASWPSEGWSGLELYTDKIIPGWKKSLVSAGLKWGRIIKLNLNNDGTKTLPSGLNLGNSGDTTTYFQSINRYRDIAFGPNGKDIYLVMDNNSATSGPGTNNPVTPGCPGCVQKYSFLGYTDEAGLSTISKTIDVTTGIVNTCVSGTAVTIDGTNNFLWVPITGPDGNILAEINAMGQNLGLITSSYYKKGGALRSNGSNFYMNRNITITPANNVFATPVKVRLYFTKDEFDALDANPLSGISTINDVRILKNNDACMATISSNANTSTITNPGDANITHGSNGYVLQTAVTSFSSFYFAANNIVLPVDKITFNGGLQPNLAANLKWISEQEINITGFELERSTDAVNFEKVIYIKALGTSNSYAFEDASAAAQNAYTLYYRLKIINSDGSTKYSNIVNINLPMLHASITIAPNPVIQDLKGIITSPITGNVNVSIYNNIGSVVMQKNIFVRKGINNFAQPIAPLAKGTYYIIVSAKGVVSRTKFEKM